MTRNWRVSRGIRFPNDIYDKLEKQAKDSKETFNGIVVRLLREKLNSASKDASVSYAED